MKAIYLTTIGIIFIFKQTNAQLVSTMDVTVNVRSGNTVTLPATLPVYQQIQSDSTFVYETKSSFKSMGSPNVESVIITKDIKGHIDELGKTYSVDFNIDKVQQNSDGTRTVGYSIKVDSAYLLNSGIKKGGIMIIEMY